MTFVLPKSKRCLVGDELRCQTNDTEQQWIIASIGGISIYRSTLVRSKIIKRDNKVTVFTDPCGIWAWEVCYGEWYRWEVVVWQFHHQRPSPTNRQQFGLREVWVNVHCKHALFIFITDGISQLRVPFTSAKLQVFGSVHLKRVASQSICTCGGH